MRAFRKFLPVDFTPLRREASDVDEAIFEAVVSTGAVDRMGDIVDVERLDTRNFQLNPVVLYGHREPIGRAHELVKQGGRLVARFTLASTNRAREVATLIREHVLNACSIGFIPLEEPTWNKERFGFDFKGCELLEFSIVAVPANAEALIQRSALPYESEETPMSDPVVITPPAPPSGFASPPPPAPPASELRTVSAAVNRRGETLSDLLVQAGLHTALLKTGGSVASSFEMTLRMLTRTLGSTQMAGADPAIAAPVQWAGLVNVAPAVPHLVDLLATVPLTSNSVTYTRLSYKALGNKAAKVAEGAAKPESILAATPATVTVDTWAHWLDATKQALADVAGLQAMVETILREGLVDKIDVDVFAVMTTAGNFTPFAGAATGETVGDGIARAVAQVAANGGRGITAAVNSGDALTQALAKGTDGHYLGMPPGLGATVVPVPVVPAGMVLAFASGSVLFGDREQVNVQLGLKNDDFVKNLVTILCEARGAVLPMNPTQVAYGAVTAAA